ncbi:hypothetical protein Tco_0779552 [Tanacetum coccineum]
MLLYIKGKENGDLLVDLVLNGPFQLGTIEVPGTANTPTTVRARTHADLTEEEKLRASVDIKATNIVLQGLPQDIYNLVNHNDQAKQIWDRVKLLIQGSELSKLVVPSFNPTDDPIKSLNKAMAFISHKPLLSSSPHKQTTRTSSNQVNHNHQDGRSTVQDCLGRHNTVYANNGARTNTTTRGTNGIVVGGQGRVVKCYNCQEEAYLDPKQLAFLADNVDTYMQAQASQEILTLSAFQTDDLDAYDSDCDDAPSARVVLMANLSSYDLHVPSEEAQCSEQPYFNNDTNIDITSDNNIISYEQYLQEIETSVVQSTSSTTQQDELLMSVIDEMQSQVAKCNKVQQENKIVNETLSAELEGYKEQVIVDRNAKVADFEKLIHSLKLQLNATVESQKTLSTTVEILKEASKKKEDKYLDEIIDLQKDKKALDNVVYKMAHRKVPALYDGHTIVKKHDVVTDTEETLELAEESRLKMLAKQNDETVKEKKVNFAPVNYVALNKLSEHLVKHFVPQKQLFAKQAFWLPISQPVSEKQQVQVEPVFEKEIPMNYQRVTSL